jgi:hypothetical protein
MDRESFNRIIRAKLADGRLPQNSIPRVWGGASNGETCDARRSSSWRASARRAVLGFSST